MASKKTAVGGRKGAEKVLKGYAGKGTPMGEAGQVDVDALTGVPTTSIAFAIRNVNPVIMRKKKATGYEYEQVDPDNIAAMKALQYEVVASAGMKIRTLSSTVSGAVQSKVLHVKLNASVSYEWNQSIEVYNKSGLGRTKLAQVDGAVPNEDERVTRASGFILNTEYSGIPAGTYIPLKGIKARYRYAAPTDTNSGVYTSFAGESAWTAPVV